MSDSKIQRWLDLLATLLVRRSPATFLDLARDVPAYLADGSVGAEAPSRSFKRMFERDKLELRELGIEEGAWFHGELSVDPRRLPSGAKRGDALVEHRARGGCAVAESAPGGGLHGRLRGIGEDGTAP